MAEVNNKKILYLLVEISLNRVNIVSYEFFIITFFFYAFNRYVMILAFLFYSILGKGFYRGKVTARMEVLTLNLKISYRSQQKSAFVPTSPLCWLLQMSFKL